MKRANVVLKSLLGIFVMMLVVGVWVSPADAQTTDQRTFDRLEYALRFIVIRQGLLQDHIDAAGEVADLAADWIAGEAAKGNDTTALEAALAALRAKIDEAQGFADTAASVLDAKAGFDDEGQVVDAQEARDTIKEASQAIRAGNEALRTGRRDFRQAMQQYRQDKRANR